MSLKQRIHNTVKRLNEVLQSYINRKWYTLLLGFLAFIDYFILIIPMDGILISSIMLHPKRWLSLAIGTAIGSTLGSLLFYLLIKHYGLSWILNVFPNLTSGSFWDWTLQFFDNYGIFLVFVIAATPLAQQPVVALAAISHTPFLQILIAVSLGRLIKCLIISYISSHSPHLISKLWGVQEELDEVGIHLKTERKN